VVDIGSRQEGKRGPAPHQSGIRDTFPCCTFRRGVKRTTYLARDKQKGKRGSQKEGETGGFVIDVQKHESQVFDLGHRERGTGSETQSDNV